MCRVTSLLYVLFLSVSVEATSDPDFPVVYAAPGIIQSITINGSPTGDFHRESADINNILDITYDQQLDVLFVAHDDTQLSMIRRDSSEIEAHISVDEAIYLARYNPKDENMYVAHGDGDVWLYDMRKGGVELKPDHLVVSNLHPVDIAVDHCYEQLYFIKALGTGEERVVQIVRSSLLGGSFEIFMDESQLSSPSAIAIDILRRKLIIAEGAPSPYIIECNVDSKECNTVLELAAGNIITSMVVNDNLLIFFEATSSTIRYVDLRNSGSSIMVKDVDTSDVKLTSTAKFECPHLGVCDVYNGGCVKRCSAVGERVVCNCGPDSPDQIIVKTRVSEVAGFCDWTNKTKYCTSDQISCDYGMRCLSKKKDLCNGVQDCIDGTDESPFLCHLRTCGEKRFKCHNGRCIDETKQCDHHNDCGDNSDELMCEYDDCTETQFKCPGNDKCIERTDLCDMFDDCQDGLVSDEQQEGLSNCGVPTCEDSWYAFWGIEYVPCEGVYDCHNKNGRCDNYDYDCLGNVDEANCEAQDCSDAAFQCDNSKCVYYQSWVCDGYDDCGDLSDEADCDETHSECQDGDYTCANGNCIPNSWRCDGDNDCGDNSDEDDSDVLNCATLPCEDNEMRCTVFDQSRSRCVGMNRVCDGKADCEDAQDEENCPRSECASSQFTCANGLCVHESWQCDHDNDCGDNSDEVGCQYRECSDGEFTCHNARCIAMMDKCDGINHCGDNTDEINCPQHDSDGALCEDGQFLCAENKYTSTACIAMEKVCDGEDDCDHGSDEVNCGLNECLNPTMTNCEQECEDLPTGYRCTCNGGAELDTDGISCIPVDQCALTPRVCSQTCHHGDPNATCSCVPGYTITLDNEGSMTVCKHDSDIEPRLLYSNELSVRTANLLGEEEVTVFNEGDTIVASDFIWRSEDDITYFLIDVTTKSIISIDQDGNNKKILENKDVPGSEGIAVDWVMENLYWTDNVRKTIEVARLDGTSRKILKSTGLSAPRAIAVHPEDALVFYSDWGYGTEHIGRVDMDGENSMRIVTEGVSWPNALTVDYTTKQLFWADAHLHAIESCNFDGSGRFKIVQGSSDPDLPTVGHPFAISVFENYLYWTDWNELSIERADKRDRSDHKVLLQLAKRPMDIHVLHPLRQPPMASPADGASPCSHLTLLSNNQQGYVCACPEHFVLRDDGRTCQQNCPAGYLLCADNTECYPMERKCDKEQDCADGSDEPADCPANHCLPGQLKCLKSQRCVEHSTICNGREECATVSFPDDRTDEDSCQDRTCPHDYFKCDNHLCVPNSAKCNGFNECGDLSDESSAVCQNNQCDEETEFKCVSNGMCIPKSYVCDIDRDCPDGSDEPATCAREATQCFAPQYFSCTSSYRCISSYLVCNGFDNCRDNSDEQNCEEQECRPGYFQCADKQSCVPNRWVCDMDIDCADGSDEQDCEGQYRECDEHEFRCDNQRCIPNRYRCDLENDCGDNSDEPGDCGDMTCHSDQFQCVTSGHCIPEYKHCLDGVPDCPDASDEANCGYRFNDNKYCRDWQYTCNNTVCISQSAVCNAQDDCGDGSDEIHSSNICHHVSCEADYLYSCNSGECIYDFHVCNGKRECSDGSDEDESLCHSCDDVSMHQCHSGNQCFSDTQACDDEPDCDDNTDEIGCHTQACSDNNGGCEESMECIDLESGDHICLCPSGLRHDPLNHKRCIDINECEEDWSSCSQECEDEKNGFTCKCADGFKRSVTKDQCKALGDPRTLLFPAQDNIRRLVTTASVYLEADLLSEQSSISSLDFIYDNSTIYWVDEANKAIRRALVPEFDSQSVTPRSERLQIKHTDSPKVVALDWANDLLYWLDQKEDKYSMMVSKSDGRYSKILHDRQFIAPSHMAVSPSEGRVYISDMDQEGGKIYMWDGNALTTIVSEPSGDPSSLAIDHFKQNRLYWADYTNKAIFSVLPDGSDRRTIFYHDNLRPYSLAVFESEVYFTADSASGGDSGIFTTSKFDKVTTEASQVTLGVQMRAPLAVYQQHARPADVLRRCENHPCSHLCLPTSSEFRCACPEGSSFRAGSVTHCKAEVEQPRNAFFVFCGQNSYYETKSGECICKEGYHGTNCQLTSERKIEVVGILVLAFISLMAVVTLMALAYRFRATLARPMQTVSNTVSFHVGGRANPSFQSGDHDRVNLGRDFDGIVDDTAIAMPAESHLPEGFSSHVPGRTAFSNPVYEVEAAQKAAAEVAPADDGGESSAPNL